MSEIKSYKTYIPQKNTGIEIVDSIEHAGRLSIAVGSFTFNSSLDLVMTGYLAESTGTGLDGEGVMDAFGVRTVGWQNGNISVGATNATHIILRVAPNNNANWIPVVNTDPKSYGTYKLHLVGNNGKVTSVQLYLNDILLQDKAPQTTNITGNEVYFGSSTWVTKSRIDSAQVYVDGEFVRDLVPAYNHATAKYGLVDTLTDTFYSQAADGIAPSSVTPTPTLNYIISIPNYKTNVSTGDAIISTFNTIIKNN